ncbi:MAG: diguanylate cyclase [Pseudomonadota bacterium]
MTSRSSSAKKSASRSLARKAKGGGGPKLSAAEKYKVIAQRAPVMLWTCNAEGELSFTSDRWHTFIGASDDKELREKWLDAIHCADRENYNKAIDSCLVSQQASNFEYRVTRMDGETRWVNDVAEPFYNMAGEFCGLIGTTTDVTEEHQHLAALRHSHEEAQAQERENTLIDNMNSYLQVCLSMRETYPVVDYYVRRIFLGCSGAVYLFNDNRTVVEPVVTWGIECGLGKVLDPNDSWALRQGKIHEVPEFRQGMLCNFLAEHPINGYICVPIIAQGDMIGMLHVQYAEIPDDFSVDEVEHHLHARRRLAMTTADNLALALVSLKLREALKQQSVKDPLTQLYNRRYMSDSLEREFARCRRARWELSVILIDVDHFKRYNDQFGHDAGDLVLRELADFIRQNLRGEDIACRFGGEEFLLLMPGAKQNEAKKRAEELREGVKQLNIRYQGSRLSNITVSAGVAACPGSGEDEATLFKAVDRALYQAKEGGRDRVCVAEIIKPRTVPGRLKSVGK